MRDRVMQLIFVLGIAYMLGIVTGVKASDVLDRAQDSAAEIMAEKNP